MPADNAFGTESGGPHDPFEKVEALAKELEDSRRAQASVEHQLAELTSLMHDLAKKLEGSRRAQELLVTRLETEAGSIVEVALSHPEQMRHLWQSYCAEGMAGRTADVHARREALHRQFQVQKSFLARARNIAELVARITGNRPAGADFLPEAAAGLERLGSSIFTRWKTQEDLEDMLAEMYPLPNSRLEELGEKYQAPLAWYEQEGKPF